MHVASLKSKFSNQAVFSASAATFVMTLSAMFPVRACDKFTFTKFVVVLVTVCSLVSVTMSFNCASERKNLITINNLLENFQCFIAFSDPAFSSFEWRTRSSVLLTVFSSFLFSLYVVFLMNNADHEEKLDIPLLCGTFRNLRLSNLFVFFLVFFFFVSHRNMGRCHKSFFLGYHRLQPFLVNAHILRTMAMAKFTDSFDWFRGSTFINCVRL